MVDDFINPKLKRKNIKKTKRIILLFKINQKKLLDEAFLFYSIPTN